MWGTSKGLRFENNYWNGVRTSYTLYNGKESFVVSDKTINKLIDYYNHPRKLEWELEEARAYSKEMERRERKAKETRLAAFNKAWYEAAAEARYAKTRFKCEEARFKCEEEQKKRIKTPVSPDNYFHWSSTGKKPVPAPRPDSPGDWFQLDGSKWKLMVVSRGVFNGKPRYQFLGIKGEAYRWGRICNTIPELFTPSRRCYQRINGPGGVVVEK